jgi:hypothetical protein
MCYVWLRFLRLVLSHTQVDFAPPKDYKEPQRPPPKSTAEPMDGKGLQRGFPAATYVGLIGIAGSASVK